MPSKFKIQISNPCHEDWGRMQAHTNGKFCGSCQKPVIDFTCFSDQELQDWFIKNEEKSCGRFKPEQLDRLIIAKENYTLSKFKPSLIAASLLAFLSFPKLSDAKVIEPPYSQTELYPNNTSYEKQAVILTDTLKIIKGRIIDKDDKQSLPSVSVMVNQRLAFASTDEKGNFEIKLPSDFDDKNCTLTITYIGYKPLYSTVNLSTNKRLNLELCASNEMMGDVVITRAPFWKRIYYKMRNQLRDINPFYAKKN